MKSREEITAVYNTDVHSKSLNTCSQSVLRNRHLAENNSSHHLKLITFLKGCFSPLYVKKHRATSSVSKIPVAEV